MTNPPTELFPRKVLIAFAALIGFSLLLAATARITGFGISHVQPEPVVQSVDLRFEDQADGAIVVRDVANGAVIATLAPETNQFLRGVRRAMARERRAHRVAEDRPFQIARLADGRHTIRDPDTGRVFELRSFGPTNEGSFAALLDAARPPTAAPPPVTAAQSTQPR
jgi:putative photosynthetic complex assembly protein